VHLAGAPVPVSAFIAATVGNHLAGRRHRRELVIDFRQGLIV